MEVRKWPRCCTVEGIPKYKSCMSVFHSGMQTIGADSKPIARIDLIDQFDNHQSVSQSISSQNADLTCG